MPAAYIKGTAEQSLAADSLTYEKYSYHEGFENAFPEVKLWASNGDAKVNYLGLSGERAFEGKKSLKLDVTITGGSYHYFGFMLRVPCEGKLRMSARLWLGEGSDSNVQAGFGANFVFPPTGLSGCGPVETYTGPTNAWKQVERDMVEWGREDRAGVFKSHGQGARPEDAGILIDRWSIFIHGREGQRVVVYLDDVRIEGEVPPIKVYEKEIASRWQKRPQAEFTDSIKKWKKQVVEADTVIASLDASYPDVRDKAKEVRTTAANTIKLLDECKARGYYSVKEEHTIQSGVAALGFGANGLPLLSKARKNRRPFILFSPHPITDSLRQGETFPFPEQVCDTLSCKGCRGEYEPFTALLYAVEPLKALTVKVSDLRNGRSVISSDSIDVRVVKSWYKAGLHIWEVNSKALYPELLLKDDSLVLVDTAKKENYLRSTAPDGTNSYLLCSGKTSDNLADVRPIDAVSLQPVNISKDSFKKFWFTVHVPVAAKAGNYKGMVTFTSGKTMRKVPLVVTVYPFNLEQPKLIYSIYYRGTLSPDGKPSISSELKSEEQYRAEIADMKAHGVLFPSSYQGLNEKSLARALDIRKEVGMPVGMFFNLADHSSSTDTSNFLHLAKKVKQWIDFVKPYGYKDVYFYGLDEATGEQLTAQRIGWKTIQNAGGKNFVACGSDAYGSMGGLLNCAVLGGRPAQEQARKWHGVGSQVFCYSYPQAGELVPETYRRHFGLELWKASYDGAMDYAYQHGLGHIWNDFDHKVYRDHCFAYPTVNGVVPTIQWEGFREAVDDVSYVSTLKKVIEQCPAAKNDFEIKARAWLDNINPQTVNLDSVRSAMVQWIKKLVL